MTNTDRLAQALRDLRKRMADHLANEPNAEIIALASLAPAAVEGEPKAWLHQDGDRVITAQTKAAALRDGGASASSVASYTVPLVPAAQVSALTAQCEGLRKDAERPLLGKPSDYTFGPFETLDFDNGCVNWPRDPANGRLLCTPERPMPKDAEGQWAHSGSHCTHDGEYRDWYACRDCGKTWYEELAE